GQGRAVRDSVAPHAGSTSHVRERIPGLPALLLGLRRNLTFSTSSPIFPRTLMPHRHRSTPLRLEQLEDRVVPAGNVLVAVQGTTIFVAGDSAANGLEISLGTSANQFVFRGLDGTTVNGSANPVTQNVTGGLAHLHIDLGAGNDRLVISNR